MSNSFTTKVSIVLLRLMYNLIRFRFQDFVPQPQVQVCMLHLHTSPIQGQELISKVWNSKGTQATLTDQEGNTTLIDTVIKHPNHKLNLLQFHRRKQTKTHTQVMQWILLVQLFTIQTMDISKVEHPLEISLHQSSKESCSNIRLLMRTLCQQRTIQVQTSTKQ